MLHVAFWHFFAFVPWHLLVFFSWTRNSRTCRLWHRRTMSSGQWNCGTGQPRHSSSRPFFGTLREKMLFLSIKFVLKPSKTSCLRELCHGMVFQVYRKKVGRLGRSWNKWNDLGPLKKADNEWVYLPPRFQWSYNNPCFLGPPCSTWHPLVVNVCSA